MVGADWTNFITSVSDIIFNEQPNSAREFGNLLAKEYLTAVKNKAKCIPGTAVHQSSPGESAFIASYENWFEDLYEKGEPVILSPETDEEKEEIAGWLASAAGAGSRLTIFGKDQDPEYAFLEGEIGEGIQYEPTEELDKYLEEYRDDPTEDLYRFKNYEFHRLDGEESMEDLAKIVATRLIMRFEEIESGDKRYEFWTWLDRFEKDDHVSTSNSTINQRRKTRRKAYDALKKEYPDKFTGFSANSNKFHELVSTHVKDSIKEAHPPKTEWTDSNGNKRTNGFKAAIEVSVKAEREKDLNYPWPFETTLPSNYEEMKPAEKLKVRYPFKLNRLKIQEPYDENQKMPPILTKYFINEFSWSGNDNYGVKYNDVDTFYIKDELRKKWFGCPLTESDEGSESIVNIDMSKTGTVAKQIRNVLIIELGEEAAMLAAGGSKEDPYKELAKATLLYWKAATIQPFAASPPTPPCTAVPPLQGKYIGVSYGNQKKLADNIRRALNSGKDAGLNKRKAADDVAKALAYSYFTHLSEMKFIYLGGIPAGVVPFIPMIGFDATVI